MRKRFLPGLLVGLVLLGGMSAQAAEVTPELPVHRRQKQGFHLKIPDTTGPIVTDTALPQAPWTASFQINAFLAFTGGNFTRRWGRESAGGDFMSLSMPVQFYYGLGPRTEIQIFIPYLQNWASQVGSTNRAAQFGGIGDACVEFKYLLVKEGPRVPAVAGIFAVGFPTGHHRNLGARFLGIDQLGLGAYSFTLGFDLFKYVKPALLYGNIWYTAFANGRVNGQKTFYPDQVTFNLAAELPLSKKWVLLGEMVSTWDVGRLIGPTPNQSSTAIVSVLPAIEFLPTHWVNIAAGIKIDLIGKNTAFTYAPVVALFLYY